MDKIGFIKYLESKNLAQTSINAYVKFVESFFVKMKKEDIQITKPDVLKFLEYLKNNRKTQNSYRKNYLIALNHYFTYLYENEKISQNPCLLLKIRGVKRKTLCKIYTPEELDQLFDNYYISFIRNFDDSHYRNKQQKQEARLSRERNVLMLSILIYQGVRASDILKIRTGDIDLIKATLRIQGGKRRNGRTLPLKASQIGLFMHYLQNIRPQLLNYQIDDTDILFLSLFSHFGKKKADSDKFSINIFSNFFRKQLKTIDKQFISLQQIRTSVIANWLKTNGLRKTQYLAGHRYVSTTESYLPNNIDNLIDDINKLHPLDF